PPTGRIAQFLNVNAEVAGLARIGPVRTQADKVMDTIRSARTAVHFVTLLEEMPAQETADGVAEIVRAGMNPGRLIVNMVREPLFPPEVLAGAERGEVDVEALTQGLKAAQVDRPSETADGLAREVAAHARRVRAEATVRARLDGLGLPMLDLPYLGEGIDTAALYRLADRLAEQGVDRWARRGWTWTPCWATRRCAPSCAAGRAGSARPSPRPHSGCGPRRWAGARWSSRSIRRGGWPSRWG